MFIGRLSGKIGEKNKTKSRGELNEHNSGNELRSPKPHQGLMSILFVAILILQLMNTFSRSDLCMNYFSK